MTETRAISYSSATDAVDWAADVDANVNRLSGYHLGRIQNVAGTNAITGNLILETGFSALSNGARGSFVAVADNTGAMTLQIFDTASPPASLTSAIQLKRADGTAVAAGEVVTGKLYEVEYDATDVYFRITTHINSSSAATGIIRNYAFTKWITSTETWTVPWDCYYKIWLIGAGGSGGVWYHSSILAGRASGAGAGQAVLFQGSLSAADELVCTPGTGGAAVTGVQNTVVAGNDGTDTTVTGPDSLSLTAEGGKAGDANNTGTVSGGLGGSDSGHGGDVAFDGGDGGDCSADETASAGGAVGINADGIDGLDLSSTPSAGQGAGFHPTDPSITVFDGGTQSPFDLNGAVGGVNGVDSGMLCGGPGMKQGVPGNPGFGGGSGGRHGASAGVNAPGGNGLVVIEFTGPI